MMDKIKPKAQIVWNDGNDGRDAHYDIKYTCPKCGKWLREGVVGCDECGTFFDWTETAHIKMTPTIVWK